MLVALFRLVCGPGNYGAILRACASTRPSERTAQSRHAVEAMDLTFQDTFVRVILMEIKRLGGAGAAVDADALRDEPAAAFSAFDFLLHRIDSSHGA